MSNQNDPSIEAIEARCRELLPRFRTLPQAEREAFWAECRTSPELNAEWERQISLKTLGGIQRIFDEMIVELRGRDRPLVHGGPGRENEIVAHSSIDFWRRAKERFVEHAEQVRQRRPLQPPS